MRAMLTPRTRCLIAWLSVVLLPLALIAAVAIPWWSEYQDLSDRVDRDHRQIQGYQRIVARLPALSAELAEVRSNDDFKAYSFDEPTAALAGATLQRMVQEMIRAVEARPISAQILPVQASDAPPRVSIRVQIQADTEQFFELLYRIEDARPFLFIEQMSIRSVVARAQRVQRRGPRPAQQSQPQSELTIRLDVFGYTLAASS